MAWSAALRGAASLAMVQVIKYLPHSLGDLSSGSQQSHKEPGTGHMSVSAQEVETSLMLTDNQPD